MSFVLGPRSVAASRHLNAELSAYADRSLPAATLLACDRHVAICPGCQVAVDAERRLLGSLRSTVTPELPSGLESALLCLAVYAVPTTNAVPTTAERTPPPLAVVGRSAPAMHRSPVRAALLASLAAGASAAAAWSVGVSAVGPSAPARTVSGLPLAVATASPASGNGSSSQAATFVGPNGAVAGMAGSLELTKAITTSSPTAAPMSGVPPTGAPLSWPWPGVRPESGLERIDP